MLSGARTGTTNFTAYISPYLVVSNGGNYTKHIYMGGQRITSKVSNSEIFTTSPVTTTDLQAKYTAQTAKIKERFDSLGVVYKGTAQSGGLITKNPTPEGKVGASYYYHSDHLGSSSLITDQSGTIVQHLEYVPFGETFIDERKSQSSWTTPYLFSGKERDEETGLLYFGARYQDSKYGIWYSVDPMADKYPNIGSYVYCADNPVKYVDPDGKVLLPWWKSPVLDNKNSVILGFRSQETLPKFNQEYNKQWKTSKLFRSFVTSLNRSQNKYSVYQNYAWSEGGDGGNYGHGSLEFYEQPYQGAIFEEFFHAGQNEFYGNKFTGMSELRIEFEAKVAKIVSSKVENNTELLSGDIVIENMSKSDNNIITNYILGKKVDQKTLNSTLKKLQQTIIKEYNLPENSTVDINKSLNYLKTLLKNETKK